jgi:hypothetical protein
MLSSPRSLVQYFATCAVSELIRAIENAGTWDAVDPTLKKSLLFIVESVLQLSRTYGIPDLMCVVSRLIKDPQFLEQIIDHVPLFTTAAFDLASEVRNAWPVIDSVLNFIVCFATVRRPRTRYTDKCSIIASSRLHC